MNIVTSTLRINTTDAVAVVIGAIDATRRNHTTTRKTGNLVITVTDRSGVLDLTISGPLGARVGTTDLPSERLEFNVKFLMHRLNLAVRDAVRERSGV